MCEPATIAMTAVAVVGSVVDGKNKQKAATAQEEARRMQKIEMMRQANVNDANLQLQDMGNYDEARELLAQANIEAIQTEASVSTAIGESMIEGKSMERVQRQTANQALHTKSDINKSYERSYYNIYAKREANRNQLISAYNGMPSVQQPSELGLYLDAVGAGIQGASAGSQLSGAMKGGATKTNTGLVK